MIGNYRDSAKPAVQCEVCKAIEILELDSSAHDLWACTDEKKSNHGLRRKFISPHLPVSKSEKRAASNFRFLLQQLLPRH